MLSHGAPYDAPVPFPAGGRFFFAYEVIMALAIYQMLTAVVSEGGGEALSRESRLLLAAGTLALLGSISAMASGSGGLIAMPALHYDEKVGRAVGYIFASSRDEPLLWWIDTKLPVMWWCCLLARWRRGA